MLCIAMHDIKDQTKIRKLKKKPIKVPAILSLQNMSSEKYNHHIRNDGKILSKATIDANFEDTEKLFSVCCYFPW